MRAIIVLKQTGGHSRPRSLAHRRRNSCQDLDAKLQVVVFANRQLSGEEIMHRIATRFGLILTVGVLVAANVDAQQPPSAASPNLQPNAGSDEAAVKRVVD